MIKGGASAGRAALWQDFISSQLDADRMDYLVRDSYHAGVEYGRFDWRRVIATIELVRDPEAGAPRLGVSEAGRHAAEGLILARYMMFNQVYFHKTRVILDYHLRNAIREMLPSNVFPKPEGADLDAYLEWDDWRVQGLLSHGAGGEHGKRLVTRDFFREIWESPEFPSLDDQARMKELESGLGQLVAAKCEASKSWYKVGETDLLVAESSTGRVIPLSKCSAIVGNLKPTRRTRLYVRNEDKEPAKKILRKFLEGDNV